MTNRRPSITFHTSRNLGDHGQEVQIAHEYVPGETVKELLDRIMPEPGRFGAQLDGADFVVLRLEQTAKHRAVDDGAF